MCEVTFSYKYTLLDNVCSTYKRLYFFCISFFKNSLVHSSTHIRVSLNVTTLRLARECAQNDDEAEGPYNTQSTVRHTSVTLMAVSQRIRSYCKVHAQPEAFRVGVYPSRNLICFSLMAPRRFSRTNCMALYASIPASISAIATRTGARPSPATQ